MSLLKRGVLRLLLSNIKTKRNRIRVWFTTKRVRYYIRCPLIHAYVFAGGGIRAIAYAGVLKALEEARLIPFIKHVAGSSAGAIAALLIALGYNAKEAERVLRSLSPKTLTDSLYLGRMQMVYRMARYGYIHTGEQLGLFLRQVIEQKLGKSSADQPYATTLRACQKNLPRLKTIRIVSTNRNYARAEYLDETQPNETLWKMVLASASIPYYYRNVKLGNDLYMDGGATCNYALAAFDQGHDVANMQTLGFQLTKPNEHNTFQRVDRMATPKTWRDDIELNVECALYAETRLNARATPAYFERTIEIPTGKISTLDFNLDEKAKDELIANGYNATKAYLMLHELWPHRQS